MILSPFAPRLARMAALAALAALAAAAPAMAQQPTAPAEVRPANDVAVGDTTRSLLDIQRSGSQAGPQQPLTGDQAALGYARYMRSFTHPLPEFFSTISTGSPLRGGAGSQPMNGQ
ncbi:Protein of unknown function [Ralstonia sp. 25mfcol4.1]|uniref:DUF3613 domain-containing protein n=1 Tax=Burkholderiaceae TaxID=119060 RepID=UPI00088C863E|nr:DUF3613 domain-containing protein [Ralstonia sp. 25mfcol4.1]SDP31304.1 Protein of unknown function [Ralstonia sp. 25mfcol4.1]